MTLVEPGQASVGATTQDTILVVDDEPAVRSLFSRVLRDAGFATLEASDGLEAVEILERAPVDLVLLDSTMPRLDGIGAIRRIRLRPEMQTLPIILVTAKAELEDRVRGLAEGADDYLAKPVALDELEARVRAQLRSHAAWTEAIDREVAQRRAMTAALRRVPTEGSAEHVARALVEELLPVLDIDALALISVLANGSVVPLATAGDWSPRFRPAIAVEPSVAQRLLDETAKGPWVVDPNLATGAIQSDGGIVTALRLDGPSGTFGLLATRLAARRDGAREIARRLPLLVELADLVGAVLGPVMEGEGDGLQERIALDALISERAFTPFFQPVVSLAERDIVGYEALTRFHDGTPPDRRFAAALRLGRGRDLERATLSAAVEAARGLADGRLLALNVSPDFVLAGDLPAILADAGREVVLEITEHAPIDDYPALLTALARIQPPVQVAVDDAGSGYASLRHILSLHPAYVKLDLDWVRHIEVDPARQALVAGLAHFANEIGCRLIGEGIETEAEREALLRLGVPLGQGYLLGRPAPTVSDGGRATRAGLPSTTSGKNEGRGDQGLESATRSSTSA